MPHTYNTYEKCLIFYILGKHMSGVTLDMDKAQIIPMNIWVKYFVTNN